MLRLNLILGAVGLLAFSSGCRTNGREFAEIEAEAAAHPVKSSVRIAPLGAELAPLPKERLVGTWECNYQTDILDFRPILPSPISSVLVTRDVLTFMDDGVYFEKMYQDGKLTVDTDGLWSYEDGVLTLEIRGDTRRQRSTVWRGEDVWEQRYYPESAAVDWWQSFYEREKPGCLCETTGGYRADGCLRLIHRVRFNGGSGYIVDALDSPRLYKRVKGEAP